MKNEKGDQARQNPSRRRFHEHQKPKAAPKPQPNTEATADYLQEVRERINALTVALADRCISGYRPHEPRKTRPSGESTQAGSDESRWAKVGAARKRADEYNRVTCL
jgi:hypothetical protein